MTINDEIIWHKESSPITHSVLIETINTSRSTIANKGVSVAVTLPLVALLLTVARAARPAVREENQLSANFHQDPWPSGQGIESETCEL
jgi:hypothetical protein